MVTQIRINLKYIVFLVFVLFLVVIGFGNYDTITGFSIKDINDEWTLKFSTGDRANLIIEMETGKGYSSNDDVQFVELRCGESVVIPNILTNMILYNDYYCDEISSVKFIVNSKGKFRQIIRYGENKRIISFKK